MTDSDEERPRLPKKPESGNIPRDPGDHLTVDELRAYVAKLVDQADAMDQSGHVEELVKLNRWTAQRLEQLGRPDDAKRFRALADNLSEASAFNSEQANNLRARHEHDKDGE
jgi:hypothetical protein